MPQNVYLLCGDANLEPMAPLISERAGQAALIPSASPWRWVHLTVKTLLDNISKRGDEEWIVLVDTNPSFSIYTEIAISSVNRLIVPVNSDDASRVATNAMFTLIHGADPPHPIYGQYTYASRAAKEAIERPKIHLVVGNRLTQYDGPATAFAAMSDATAQALYEAYQADTSKFTKINGRIPSSTKFRDIYSVPLRDFITAGVVAAHLGIPLSRLTESTYDIHGRSVRVDARRVQECRSAVNDVVARI